MFSAEAEPENQDILYIGKSKANQRKRNTTARTTATRSTRKRGASESSIKHREQSSSHAAMPSTSSGDGGGGIFSALNNAVDKDAEDNDESKMSRLQRSLMIDFSRARYLERVAMTDPREKLLPNYDKIYFGHKCRQSPDSLLKQYVDKLDPVARSYYDRFVLVRDKQHQRQVASHPQGGALWKSERAPRIGGSEAAPWCRYSSYNSLYNSITQKQQDAADAHWARLDAVAALRYKRPSKPGKAGHDQDKDEDGMSVAEIRMMRGSVNEDPGGKLLLRDIQQQLVRQVYFGMADPSDPHYAWYDHINPDSPLQHPTTVADIDARNALMDEALETQESNNGAHDIVSSGSKEKEDGISGSDASAWWITGQQPIPKPTVFKPVMRELMNTHMKWQEHATFPNTAPPMGPENVADELRSNWPVILFYGQTHHVPMRILEQVMSGADLKGDQVMTEDEDLPGTVPSLRIPMEAASRDMSLKLWGEILVALVELKMPAGYPYIHSLVEHFFQCHHTLNVHKPKYPMILYAPCSAKYYYVQPFYPWPAFSDWMTCVHLHNYFRLLLPAQVRQYQNMERTLRVFPDSGKSQVEEFALRTTNRPGERDGDTRGENGDKASPPTNTNTPVAWTVHAPAVSTHNLFSSSATTASSISSIMSSSSTWFSATATDGKSSTLTTTAPPSSVVIPSHTNAFDKSSLHTTSHIMESCWTVPRHEKFPFQWEALDNGGWSAATIPTASHALETGGTVAALSIPSASDSATAVSLPSVEPTSSSSSLSCRIALPAAPSTLQLKRAQQKYSTFAELSFERAVLEREFMRP